MADLVDYLRSDDEAIATPAFRVLAYWDVDQADLRTAQAIVDLFIQAYGDRLAWLRYADENADSRMLAASPKKLEKASSWLAAQSEPEFMFRLHGPVDEETEEVGIPQLRLERDTRVLQGNRLALEVSVPLEDAVGFANAATSLMQSTPLSFGVMGFGFYMPLALESIMTELPMSMARYRTALELQFDSGLPGLLRPTEDAGRYWDSDPDMLGGIPDIGWRTFVGNEYLLRLPDLADAVFPESVTLTSGEHVITLTAGPAPSWGDLNLGEDISAYSAIAKALRPIAYPREIAYGNFFGDMEDDFDGRERLDAYFSRLED